MQNQVFTRTRRLSNSNFVVYFFEYYIEITIILQQIIRNLEKCVFKIAIYFNNDIINENVLIAINK